MPCSPHTSNVLPASGSPFQVGAGKAGRLPRSSDEPLQRASCESQPFA